MNSKELYKQILGVADEIDMPETLPDSFCLTPQALGQLIRAMSLTAADGKERSQAIIWDDKKQLFVPGRLFTGSTEATSEDEAVNTWVNAYFGTKAFLYYHTHPGNSWKFSARDVALFRTFPRSAYFNLVGSNKGIGALVQTKQSSHIPISSILTKILTERGLKRNGFRTTNASGMAFLLENLGYGYFFSHYIHGGLTEVRFHRVNPVSP